MLRLNLHASKFCKEAIRAINGFEKYSNSVASAVTLDALLEQEGAV